MRDPTYISPELRAWIEEEPPIPSSTVRALERIESLQAKLRECEALREKLEGALVSATNAAKRRGAEIVSLKAKFLEEQT